MTGYTISRVIRLAAAAALARSFGLHGGELVFAALILLPVHPSLLNISSLDPWLRVAVSGAIALCLGLRGAAIVLFVVACLAPADRLAERIAAYRVWGWRRGARANGASRNPAWSEALRRHPFLRWASLIIFAGIPLIALVYLIGFTKPSIWRTTILLGFFGVFDIFPDGGFYPATGNSNALDPYRAMSILGRA